MTTPTAVRPAVPQGPERCTHRETRHLVEAMRFTGWGEFDTGRVILHWLARHGVKAGREDAHPDSTATPTKIVMVLDRRGAHCAHVGDWIVFDRADNRWWRVDDVTFRATFLRAPHRRVTT
jgi:hypothetical protein